MKTLEDYKVESVIGSGSFGTCFKVRDKITNEIFAWKSINYDHLSDSKKDILTTEIDILRQLKHPNIVQYYDHYVNTKTSTIFIIMECCDGGDLGQLIEKCRLDRLQFEEQYIWRLLYQICRALQLCHNKIAEGIVLHRDIKPANIFLDSVGNAKLGDFGLARILKRSALNLAQSFVGTPHYMSPEIIKGRKYDEKSDIWALGCLIYELCTMKTPFNGRNINRLSENISQGDFTTISNIYSDDLQEIISFMLNVNSENRPCVNVVLRHPVLVRNISDFKYEYPNLVPNSENRLIAMKKLSFSPRLPSSFETNVELNETKQDVSPFTQKLRAELFGSIPKRILTRTTSHPTLNQSEDYIEIFQTFNKPSAYQKLDDPVVLTQNIFNHELKNRIHQIRAHEALLKQKECTLAAKEKALTEREKRIENGEKSLEQKRLRIGELLKKIEVGRQVRLPKRPVSLDDTYCSIEPNESMCEPTVAKLNLAIFPATSMKLFSRKTVSFKSPKKIYKYGTENIQPTSKPTSTFLMKTSFKSENTLKQSLRSSTSSKASDDLDQNPKRKSILSKLGFHSHKSSKSKKENVTNSIAENKIVNEKPDDEQFLNKIHSNNLTHRWTIENKRAAFELLAAMNEASSRSTNSGRERQTHHQLRKSVREKKIIPRSSRHRRSLMVLGSEGQNRIIL